MLKGLYALLQNRVLQVPLSVAALLVALGLIIALDYQEAQPRIESDTQCVINLGKGDLGETLFGYFQLRNRGSMPLLFELHGSCACTSLEPSKGEISPGGWQKVKVGVHLREEGETVNLTVRVRSNDPLKENLQIHATATCRMPLMIDPAHVHFGAVRRGSGGVRFLSLRDANGEPIRDVRQISAVSDDSRITVEPMKGDDGDVTLKVALSSNAPDGAVGSRLRVDFNSVQRTVAVSAEVVGPFVVSPKFLFIQPKSLTAQSFGIVVIQAIGGEPLPRLESIESPEEIEVQRYSRSGPSHVLYSVTAKPGDVKTGRIVFRFEGADPVNIELIAIAQPSANAEQEHPGGNRRIAIP